MRDWEANYRAGEIPWFERVEGWEPQQAYPGREGREWVGVFRKLPQARVAG